MKEIQLTGKYANGKVTLVDDEDYETISEWKWWARPRTNSNIFDVICRPPGSSRRVLIHRYLMGVTNPRFYVDHIDHDPLNNQKSNLRVSSCAENAMNRKKSTTNGKTSIYKGVFKQRNNWFAKIGIEGRYIHLGTYTTELAAALAYNEAAILYHKEFACLNELPNDVIVIERITISAPSQRAVKPNSGSSKYKGVCWHKRSNKWMASFSWNKVNHYLGIHAFEKDAALAYNKKAIEIHGDKAILNLIQDD